MPHLAKGAAAMKGIQGHGAHGRRLRADQAAREAPRRTDAVLPDANGTAGTVGPPSRLSTHAGTGYIRCGGPGGNASDFF